MLFCIPPLWNSNPNRLLFVCVQYIKHRKPLYFHSGGQGLYKQASNTRGEGGCLVCMLVTHHSGLGLLKPSAPGLWKSAALLCSVQSVVLTVLFNQCMSVFSMQQSKHSSPLCPSSLSRETGLCKMTACRLPYQSHGLYQVSEGKPQCVMCASVCVGVCGRAYEFKLSWESMCASPDV